MIPTETRLKLEATVAVEPIVIQNYIEDLTLPDDEYPLAQISEILDERTCPLCQLLDGKIIQRGTPEWDEYRKPSHINCRRTFIYIAKEEIESENIEPDFAPPPPDIVAKHGHFHIDPNRYSPLRVPAFADVRQFIVRRLKGEDGIIRTVLQWFVEEREL